jgi:hypothetical protein
MRWSRVPPGYRLFIVFALTIFAPGLLLAAFGARSLWHERQSMNQRLTPEHRHTSEQLQKATILAVDGVGVCARSSTS